MGTEPGGALGRLPDFALAFRNTLVFVVIVVVVGMVGGLGAATLLQAKGRLSAIGLGLMVFTWAMPPVVLGSLWKFLVLPGGLVNSILAAVHLSKGPFWLVQENLVLVSDALVNSWAVIPFSALVYRAALVDIPLELLDASSVDGASTAQLPSFVHQLQVLPWRKRRGLHRRDRVHPAA
ncbi:MAG TPA: hypothetical protein VL354_09865 [Spirochaetia bacterium]|nr:hypothetical protein [Spirochaetia bacterium]